MEIQIRRFDTALPLPEYKTSGAVAFDLPVREGAVVAPHTVHVFPLNVALKLPEGHFGLMAARGSLRIRGLMIANGIGVFDEDFAGDGDEYRAALYNFTDEPVTVERGERLVQLLILPYQRVSLTEVETLGPLPDRGGFGTTGL